MFMADLELKYQGKVIAKVFFNLEEIGMSEKVNTEYWLELDGKGIERISEIEGLEELTRLEFLSLRDNKIKRLDGLDHMVNLENLMLVNNKIEKIEGLENLENLLGLNLTNNRISKLEGLDSLVNLKMLLAANNQIEEIGNLDKRLLLEAQFASHLLGVTIFKFKFWKALFLRFHVCLDKSSSMVDPNCGQPPQLSLYFSQFPE